MPTKIIYPRITDYYTQAEVDAVISAIPATLSGTGGIITTQSGTIWYVDGSTVTDGYVTVSQLTTTSGDIVSQIPSLAGYATESWVSTNYIDNTEMTTISGDIVTQIPSLTGYATESWVSTNYIDNTEMTTISGDLFNIIVSTSGVLYDLIQTVSGGTVTLSGIGGIVTSQSGGIGGVWYIDGSNMQAAINIVGTGGISASEVGDTWYIDGSAIQVSGTSDPIFLGVTGNDTFSATGRTIEHGLSAYHHTFIIPAGNYTYDTAAKIGNIWVVQASGTDTVYCTGQSDAAGLPFLWMATPSGGTSYVNMTEDFIATGSGSYSGHTGTSIAHNLSTLNHTTVIEPAGTGEWSYDDMSKIGVTYVQRGFDYDTVYNTGGEDSEGLPFSWTAVKNGPANMIAELPCGECTASGFVLDVPLMAPSGTFTEGLTVGEGTIHIDGGGITLPDESRITQKIFMVGPDYIPPDHVYIDASTINIPKGRYFKAGYRLNGQYQDFDNMTEYWDTTSGISIDTSSIVVGGLSNQSWYSLFMTGQEDFILLPCIRVDTISYSDGETTITPANHNDGTTANNDFVTSSGIFNDYRLVYLSFDTNDGTVYTIADSTSGTPDEIKIDGDITSVVAAKDFLRMIPPDIPCLYLGCVGTSDGSTDLREYIKHKWWTEFDAPPSLGGNLSASWANTEIGGDMPPVAKRVSLRVYVGSESTSCYSVEANFAPGTTSTTSKYTIYYNADPSRAYRRLNVAFIWNVTAVYTIRNKFHLWTGSDVAAALGNIYVVGFEE